MFLAGARPSTPRGRIAAGRIVKLLFGQGHGYIRLTNDREVYFHRADLHESVSFNELAVDETVTFELLEDAVSGARAVQVKRRRGQD
jgi:hypothetical protein